MEDHVATPGLAHRAMTPELDLLADLMGGTQKMRLAGARWLPRLFQWPLILGNRVLPVFGGCARRLIAAIGKGRLMKPKTAFGRVKHGTAPPILPPDFAACISRKNDAKTCLLFAADYWARFIGRG